MFKCSRLRVSALRLLCIPLCAVLLAFTTGAPAGDRDESEVELLKREIGKMQARPAEMQERLDAIRSSQADENVPAAERTRNMPMMTGWGAMQPRPESGVPV